MGRHAPAEDSKSLALPLRDARHFLAMAAILFAAIAHAAPARAVDESIPCDPEPTDMSISYSDVILCSIDPIGDLDIFRLLAMSGEVVTLRTSPVGGSGAPCIELFDPIGTLVDQDCGSPARVDATLGQTGEYSVLTHDQGNDHLLDYTLVVERLAPTAASAVQICPGRELQDNIDPIGDLDLFFLDGTSGDVVTLLASPVGGAGAPCIELFAPTGGPVDQDCGSPARVDVTLGQTGEYSILTHDDGMDHLLDYTLAYQCIVGVCFAACIFEDGFESGDTTAWSTTVP